MHNFFAFEMKEIKEEEHSALHNDFVKKKQVNEREPDLFDEMLEPSAEKKSRKKEAEEKEFKEKETEQEEEREEEKEELIEKEIEEEAEENEKETLAKENEVNEVIEDDESFLYDVDEELDEEEDLDEDQVKKDIMEKALNESVKGKEKIPSGVPLTFLEDEKEKNVFIGRKKSIYQKYGYEGALLVGKVGEEEQNGKQVFLDSLNPHVVFVNGARGSGKCLTGDTLITLENGKVIPIKDLENEQEKILALNHSLKIQPATRTEFFKRKVQKILKIKLRSGKEIKLTPEHPLLTINGWIEAQKLELKERIAAPRIIPFFGSKKIKETDIKLLAYFIAEGHLGNQFLLFSNTDEKIINDFKEAVNEFDENLRIEIHSKPGCFRVAQKKKLAEINELKRNNKGQFAEGSKIKILKSSLMQWFESLNLYNKNSYTKFIPMQIFELEKPLIALFLNRMFSCDGSIYRINKNKNWEIDFASASKEIIDSVQSLLLRFGVLSKIREKKNKNKEGKIFNSFELVVDGENVIKFIQEIGFFGVKEEKQETALTEMVEQKRNPNIDTIPKEIWSQFKPANWTKVGREYGYSSPKSMHSSVNFSPSRQKLLKIAQIEENKGVQLLAESDIFWDEIKSVEEINEETEVFDITVPNFHNFIANNVIVHNSYVLGVIAEELAKKNKNVGMIVIDPIGVFWSMKFPNKEEKEIKSLGEWGLLPEGLDNLKVFVPGGIAKEVPKTTYDSTFSLKTSLLTGEDWCLTFGIDRFSPTGLLLEKALQNVSKGYKEIEGKKADKKEDKYSLDDIVHCLESSAELNSREKGFKQDSIRALISRFEAAKAWGIFSEHGTPLSELSKENQLSVIDSSFLDDDVTALVIGVLARRILSARKISTRKEAAQRIKTEDIDRLLEVDIPPTWLFIDEAHTLIPSGNITTPATKSLVEYVKQGRRPGCSLVFATQQPSAIDSRVLSQLDIILTHKLIFDDDIKAVFKRTPTIIPMKYKKPNFIKTLPIGVALTGDRGEETSRAFVMKVRPRMSQHEGRDAETSQMSHMLSSEQVESLMNELIYKKVLKEKSAGKNELINLINTINSKYNSRVDPENVFKELEKKGLVIGSSSASVKEELIQKEIASAKESFEAEKKEEAEEEQPIEPTEEGYTEQTELLAFPLKIDEKSVLGKIDKIRRKKILGFLGEEEKVESISLKHRTVWKVHYDYFNSKKEFISRIAFIDSVNGEFLHYRQGKFIESRGLSKLKGLNADEVKIIRFLKEPNTKAKDLEKTTHLDQGKIKKVLEKFFVTGLVDKKLLADKIEVYTLMAPIDLPPSPKSDLLESIKELPFVKVQSLAREREHFSKDEIPKLLHLLWPSVLVKKISDVFWPIYSVDLNFKGIKRTVLLDGLTAQIL